MRTLINWLGKAMVSIVFSLVVLNTCADGISPIAGDNYGTTLDFNEGNNTSQFTFFGGPYTMSTELRDKITFDLTSLPNWVTVYAGSWNQVVNGLLATDSSTILVSGQANNIYGRYGYGFDFVYAVKCAANYGSARSCSFSFTRKIVKGSADWSASRWSGVVTIRQEASSSVTYTITYKPGSYSSGNSVSDTKQSGVPLTLRDALFTRTGYTQEGWSTSTYGASKTYSLRGTYTADASTTLYPYWVGKSSTVTLDKQGGTGGTTSKTATYGSAMPSITPPTRDGYVFGGYYSGTNGSGTKYYNADGSSAHNCDFTSAKTLYAKWTQHTATNYALLVGINKYSLSGAGDLDGCVADALSMRMVCTDYGKWNKDNIVVLTNHLATLTRFRQEVSSLASIALPGDTVLIYDSGHGGAEKDAYGNYTKNSFICAYDDLYYDSVFATDLAKFNSGVKVVVMFDTCNSGGMFKSVSTSTKGESPVGNFLDNFIANASATIDSGVKSNGEKGSIASSEIGWIAAADYNVTSTDLDGMGLFTGLMVVDSGILAGNADANSDGKITFKEIYDHAVVIGQQYSLSQMAQAANTSVLSSVDLTNKHLPLATALDSANLSFSTSYVTCERLRRLGVNDGPDSWIGQSLNSGSFARSAVLANSSDAKIKVNVSGAGELSFKWKVSSELTYDKLSFIVDGVTNSVISGEKAWAEKVCSVGAGQHEFSWAYSKDGTVSKGEDCAWLDAITWMPTQTYTITYKPGSNGSGSQKTATKTHGVTLTLLGETFTREGYTQTGWATTDGGSQAYALNAAYTANAGVTLYPVWTPNTYTITYKPGSNGSGSQKTATKTHDVPLTLLGETFTRDGYTQTGWAATDGGAQVYPLNGVYTANAAATFYPVWTPIAKPQPTSEEIASALDCDYIDFVQEVSSSGTPYWMPETGNGYTGGETLRVEGLASNHWSSVITTVQGPCVVGWEWGCAKNDSECLLRMFADGDYQNPIGATNDGKWHMCYWEFADGECHTLDCCFAQGRLNSSGEGGLALYDTMAVYYQVSFDSNGGNGSAIAENGCVTKDNGDGTTNRYYEVGTSLTLPSGEGVTRGGFTFEGWTVDGDDTVYAPGDTYPVEMSPIVFKAKWAVAQTYIVIYSPGANGVGSQKTVVKTHGITLQLFGATFTRTGYTQTGWATADGGAQAYALGAEYDANAALTLYPVWTANIYTIEFSANGGDGSMEAQLFTYDVAQNLRLNTLTRTGYEFVGWARTPNAEAAEFEDGESVENLAEEEGSSLTLYAVWGESAPPVVDPKPDWKEQIVVMPYKQSVFVRIYDVTTKSYLEHAEGMLAAFAANGECRGCTTLLNGPVCKLFQLSVGIESETEKGFTLKYWNPQTGVIDVREGFDANANKKIGAINAPETYHVGEIEFELTMKSGWNWISIPVKPSDISIGSVFGGFAFSDEDSIMSADGTATYYAGQWYSGDFDAIVPGAGYCVHKGTAGRQVVTVSGEAIANSAAVRSGWNWVGCPSVSEIGLSDVSHSAGFADEDEINSADGIAVCYSGTWYSSDFDVLEPGAAYIAKLARSGTVTFGGAKAMSSRNAGIKSCLSSSKSVGAAPTWKEEIVIQPESLSLFCKIKKGDAGELIETEGSMLGVFAANGECRGATTILTVPNVGTFFQLKVGAENALESGFTLKVWDASTGKTYDVDGSFGFGDCTGDKKIGSFTSPVTKIAVVAQPIPPLPLNPTADDVKSALQGSADARLQECITEPSVYNDYRTWAETVKAPGGSTPAGAQAVKDSPNAWLSFALDSATLIQTPPADGDVKVEKFEQTATAGSFDFTVGVENIPVGDDTTPSNLAKVFGIEGGSTLSPQDMSFDKVDITFGTPENGKVKFTAGPKDKTLPTFFMKVKIK